MSQTICYCFGFTDDEIKEDVISHNGVSKIQQFIVSKKKDGQCACHLNNPKGT
ncbi:hypothetical protein V4762_04620 [Thermodesulfobium sp. 4217-1]|uniref:hypothetical protein n=1 Tax=Thermodesulfobium sp. 4217-1 TaxID=3120013 RepID=UPI003221E12E